MKDTAIRWFFAGTFPVAAAAIVVVLAVVTRGGAVSDVSLPGLLGFVVICGLAAMILIETAKRLLPLRAAYNRRQVFVWLDERSPGKGTAAMGQLINAMQLAQRADVPENDKRPAQQQLDEALGREWSSAWTTGSGVGGAFNLPAELLSAQVAAAAERALQSPGRFRDLLLAMGPMHLRESGRLPSSGLDGDPGETPDASDLAWSISSSVDQLQIRLAGRWQHYLQATACWLSGTIALVVASTDAVAGAQGRVHVISALIFGGFFAWAARDAAAALERLRR